MAGISLETAVAMASAHGTNDKMPTPGEGKKLQGGRHTHMVHVAGKLKNAGMRGDELVAALLAINDSVCDPPLPKSEISGIAKDAVEKFEFHGRESRELPPIVSLSHKYATVGVPDKKPEVVRGVIRENAKMLIQSASKAGKTWLMMQFAIAVSTGTSWLGWQVEQGRVLYCNFELQEESFDNRMNDICRQLGMPLEYAVENIDHWPLRGFSEDLNTLNQHIIPACRERGYTVVILDPFYKLMVGNENDAEAVSEFVRAVDDICVQGDVMVAYVHHYSKGSKGDTSPMDRSSGSGVFARDADALIDIAEILVEDEEREMAGIGDANAFRVTPILRDFPPKEPFEVWVDNGIHKRDYSGVLSGCKVPSAQYNGGKKSGETRSRQADRRGEEFCDWLMENIKAGQPEPFKDVCRIYGIEYRAGQRYIEASDKPLRVYKDTSDKNTLKVRKFM